MEPELFDIILGQLIGARVRRVLFWGFGEPFLHPSYLDMCSRLVHSGIRVVSNTNGHCVDEPEKVVSSGIERIIFSIDGAEQTTYAKYRCGGDLSRVMANCEALVRARDRESSDMAIVWQFIVFPWNEHEIETVQARARDFGIECVIKTNLGSCDLPSNPRHMRNVNEKGNVSMTVGVYEDVSPKCRWPVIMADGRVALCLYDSMGDHILADLRDDDLAKAMAQDRWQWLWRNQQTDTLPLCRERCSYWYRPRKEYLSKCEMAGKGGCDAQSPTVAVAKPNSEH
jgi:molybdenum cofactor biosynthesis enzyme MoaA